VPIATLREDQRFSEAPDMRRRRRAIASTLTAMGAMGFIALYQTGLLKRLPGPRLGVFNAEKVNGSDQAYSHFKTPDAVLGLGSYAVTIMFASMGPADRSAAMPWIPIALGGKAAFDAAYAGKLSVQQWTEYRAFSLWSLLAAGATMATFCFALPEAISAIQSLHRD